MKATEQYFPVVLFIMLYKVILTFESVYEIIKSGRSYKIPSTSSTVCLVILEVTGLTLCLVLFLQGNAMSFMYYDIPMFALNNEKEVDALIEVQIPNSEEHPILSLTAYCAQTCR